MGPTRESGGDKQKDPPSAIGHGLGGGPIVALALPFEFARGRPCAEVEAGLRPLGASPPARRGVPCPKHYPYRYPWPRRTRQRQAQPHFLSREQLTIYQVGSYQAVEVEAHGT